MRPAVKQSQSLARRSRLRMTSYSRGAVLHRLRRGPRSLANLRSARTYSLLVISGDSEELLVVHSDWPGTTIAGEPGIVSGILTLSATVDGGAYLNLAVGDFGAAPEECDYVEFVLSSEQADALARALASRSSRG
jgi:hypothetical protein